MNQRLKSMFDEYPIVGLLLCIGLVFVTFKILL